MGYELCIPACVCDPAHPYHPPPLDKPLRIQIDGPLVAIEKLLPSASWHTNPLALVFPQPAAPDLAKLAYRAIYGHDVRPDVIGDAIVRDEYLGWVNEKPLNKIDFYGVTFDHLVPADDVDPDVLQINILELEVTEGPYADGVAYAQQNLLFSFDPTEYIGKKVLAVPRCCQRRKGTQDRGRINDSVAERYPELAKRRVFKFINRPTGS
ncbi:hypothetical protein KVR01_000002 [Diaporthe batatas]|uniref:uncharacterized protein n=1 Tax=Diaporthe batatas TaxID=748121 RepID=UPI001D043724|nr:uncharacterized protein KVR01_000002 [Diaporthe batatas]KAG8169257.1 hypothetical protein KVR01_000002 [Diaporthe batatas]